MNLRTLAVHSAKIAKKTNPLVCFAYFTTRPSFKNLNVAFLTFEKLPLFIFERQPGGKMIKQNIPGGLFLVMLTPCIASILN